VCIQRCTKAEIIDKINTVYFSNLEQHSEQIIIRSRREVGGEGGREGERERKRERGDRSTLVTQVLVLVDVRGNAKRV
jgi:hypothetical protein